MAKVELKGKLSFKEKFGYAMGDTSANIAGRPLSSFLPIFYTDVFGLSLATVSVLLIVTRFTNGITDILMGTIADRTSSRWGKFRPWLLWSAVPLGLSLSLIFFTPNFGTTGKIIWAYATCTVFTLIYSANNIPYVALMGVMTGNTRERNSLSSYRFMGAYLGGVISLAAIPPFVVYLGHGNKILGYQYTMYVLATLVVIFSIITFLTTRERINRHNSQSQSLFRDFKDLFRNKHLGVLLTVGFLFVLCNGIKQGVTMYYFMHYLHREMLGGVYLTTLALVGMCGAIFGSMLANYFGKKQLFIMVLLISGTATSLIYFAGPHDIVYLFVLVVYRNLPQQLCPFCIFQCWPILPIFRNGDLTEEPQGYCFQPDPL
jgi:GPH family glycoside/pentoside/hexuronide:cation symporter